MPVLWTSKAPKRGGLREGYVTRPRHGNGFSQHPYHIGARDVRARSLCQYMSKVRQNPHEGTG
jgi:hypothetical protein